MDVCASAQQSSRTPPQESSPLSPNRLQTWLKFSKFMQRFERNYSSYAERQYRFKTFAQNLRKIARLNTNSTRGGAVYGVGPFSDLSSEEFRAQYLVATSPTSEEMQQSVVLQFNRSATVPGAFDWQRRGVMTGVYNQGQCGSCWAFSATENIETQWKLHTGTLHGLSMQQIVDCDDESSHGCAGGSLPLTFNYVIDNRGIDTYSCYPYQGSDGSCHYNPSCGKCERVRSRSYCCCQTKHHTHTHHTRHTLMCLCVLLWYLYVYVCVCVCVYW